MMFGLFIVFKYPPINCHSALIWQSLSRAVSPWGRRTNFFWHPVLPHKCGVPPDYGTPHLCGSEEFCRAPTQLSRNENGLAGDERQLQILLDDTRLPKVQKSRHDFEEGVQQQLPVPV